MRLRYDPDDQALLVGNCADHTYRLLVSPDDLLDGLRRLENEVLPHTTEGGKRRCIHGQDTAHYTDDGMCDEAELTDAQRAELAEGNEHPCGNCGYTEAEHDDANPCEGYFPSTWPAEFDRAPLCHLPSGENASGSIPLCVRDQGHAGDCEVDYYGHQPDPGSGLVEARYVPVGYYVKGLDVRRPDAYVPVAYKTPISDGTGVKFESRDRTVSQTYWYMDPVVVMDDLDVDEARADADEARAAMAEQRGGF